MANESQLRNAWLVAAWPGMGNVAVGAVAYLIEQLGASLVYELPSREFFDIEHVEVRNGVARPAKLPRSMVFEWTSPESPHDLLIFLGEAQPGQGGYALSHRLLDYAVSRGITRAFTFAAMASQLHPSQEPRVFGAVSHTEMIEELDSTGVETMSEGQVGGMNGILLGAGAERDIRCMSLLGEMPFFAAGIQNPKASLAVVRAFTRLSGIELDFGPLIERSKAVEQTLLQLLEKLKEASGSEEESFEIPGVPDETESGEAGEEEEIGPNEVELDYADRARIEELFEEARKDRSRAVPLKKELDRLGVFKQYENRFLDLFKRAE